MTTDQNGTPAGPSGVVPEVQTAFDQQQARHDAETKQLRDENERLQQAAAVGEGATDLVRKAMNHPQLQDALTKLYHGEALPDGFGIADASGGNPPPSQIPGTQPTPPKDIGDTAGGDMVSKTELQKMFRTYHEGLMNDIRPVAETLLKKQGDDDVRQVKEKYKWAPEVMDDAAELKRQNPALSLDKCVQLAGLDKIEAAAKQAGEEAGMRRALFSPTLEPTGDMGPAPANEESLKAQSEIDSMMKAGRTEDATRIAMQRAIEAHEGGL